MAINIRRGEDDSIRLSFPFDHERVEKVKRIPGHQWLPATKEWRLPADERTIIKVAELFGDEDIVFESGAELFNL